MNKKDIKHLAIIAFTIIIVFSFVYSLNITPSVFGNTFDKLFGNHKDYDNSLETFTSYDEYFDFLRENYKIKQNQSCQNHYCWDIPMINIGKSIRTDVADIQESMSLNSIDYSKTNIQVEGVDEPDIVKTDGQFIYLLANSKIYIIKAYPSDEALVLSNITLDEMNVKNIFLNGDKLVLFGNPINSQMNLKTSHYDFYYYPSSSTKVNIYDISNKINPELDKEVQINGSYIDARMIGDNIYFISSEYLTKLYHFYEENETINIPEIIIDKEPKKLPSNDINYIDKPGKMDTITYIVSISLKSYDINQESYMIGSSQDMYMSRNNIYLVYTDYTNNNKPIFRNYYQDQNEVTIIHKISIKNDKIEYIGQGEVPGRILNQFSMDEHNNYFRISTTLGHIWNNGKKSTNNIYILNEELERVSQIENIAPGERIYSSRFMGDKAYLVTFKKIDPFFTIDLSDPEKPKILGKLKIPGYSDYLHPYDENHIIGIGKDTVEALDSQKEGRGIDFAWYQGIKIALFDVTDFNNPKEVSKIVIGDRGTTSEALHNHKAFLFDKQKELLVIPVSIYKIPDEIKQKNDEYDGNAYGDFTFQGAVLYKLNEEGFDYKGRITHLDDEDILKTGYYGFYGEKNIFRSLFIENTLYTISDSMVKLNSLDDLSDINSVDLN